MLSLVFFDRTNIQPQNGSGTSASGYGVNNTIIINIPTRNNTALIPSESILKFSGTYTPAGTAVIQNLDSCGYHGFINRLRVFHGSNLLQDIQEYHQLAKILYDFQMPNDSVAGRFSTTTGTCNEFVGTLVGAPADGDAVAVKAVNRGRDFVSGVVAGSSGQKTFNATINLISLVGALAGGKYLPLWNMTSAPLRVELVLQDNINKAMIFSANPPANGAFTLYNVEYIAEFLELPDSAISAINSGSSSPMQMVFPDYRAYTSSYTLTTSQTNISMPVPAKFSSLKSLFVNQRFTTGATAYYPIASGRYGLLSYNWRVGSETLPSNAPNTLTDMFNEACKCFGSIADIQYQPSVDLDSYAPDDALVVSPATGDIQASYNVSGTNALPAQITSYINGMVKNSGSFVVGIDLETYQNTDKSSIFSGMNTNTSDIFFQPVYMAMSSANQAINLTCFANFDCVLVCENGVAYVRY